MTNTLYFFLHANGFGKIEYKNTKRGDYFCPGERQHGKRSTGGRNKGFHVEFLKDRYLLSLLRNVVRNRNQYRKRLEGLPN